MASTSTLVLVNNETITTTKNGTPRSFGPTDRSFLGALVIANVSGGSPTFDVDIETSPDRTNWFNVGSFAQVTADDAKELQISRDLFVNIRAVVTVGGTTPTGDVTVKLWFDPGKNR